MSANIASHTIGSYLFKEFNDCASCSRFSAEDVGIPLEVTVVSFIKTEIWSVAMYDFRETFCVGWIGHYR